MNGWLRSIKDVGFPIAVALILLGILTGLIPWPLDTIQKSLAQHVRYDAAAVRLLRQICRNSSPDYALSACETD